MKLIEQANINEFLRIMQYLAIIVDKEEFIQYLLRSSCKFSSTLKLGCIYIAALDHSIFISFIN